ncbi:XAP5 protein [Necator americanus]|uniref:Protein FAM50 homolog n=1 Tax=Necator americanus TaxID=51031 RepID=W2TN49_NECAM|nr:XAP5 protein [Necator americanus]ETN83530.1 XAP5 protein [Necator americanus]
MSRADAGRLIHLSKKRERAKEDMEQQLKKMEEESSKRSAGISSKFTANYDAIEENLKSKTVGLVTLDEMREKQKDVVNDRRAESQVDLLELEVTVARGEDSKLQKSDAKRLGSSAQEKVAQKRVLSFAFEDEEEEEEAPVVTKKRVGMDPTIDTSFLPDKEREAEIAKRKEELAAEWRAQQEREKNEEITVAFAYWDGSSHRKNLKVLKKEFTELKTCVPESLMFVKEDLIIPHFYTFQDFIVTKAMGKTGPLYEFDAAGDVRIRQDAALDCGEAHPAKVVLRNWYEKNKHIYPASRWEPFVPNKKYGRTIDDLSTI